MTQDPDLNLERHEGSLLEGARVSIVILTYNDLECMTRYLGTVLDILPDPLIEELLILDNASTDGTREYLMSLADRDKVHVHMSDSNLGVALGRARLFSMARGDIVASLDSDVELRGAAYLHRAARLLLANPGIGVCGASGYLVSFDRDRFGLIPCDQDRTVDCVSGFCQIFPRYLLGQVAIDAEFSPFWCEDTDFCFQAKARGFQIYRLGSGSDLYHRYRSIDVRRHDPRKDLHEARLVRKWKGQLDLLGERLWPRISVLLHRRLYLRARSLAMRFRNAGIAYLQSLRRDSSS